MLTEVEGKISLRIIASIITHSDQFRLHVKKKEHFSNIDCFSRIVRNRLQTEIVRLKA